MSRVFTKHNQFRHILVIDDIQKETIFGIVGRMEVLISYFEEEPTHKSLLPFLKTYYFVTKAAAEKYVERKQYFSNLRDYELLDIYFAQLYFKPLLKYLEKGEMMSPWNRYFTYCQKPDSIPFLQMLLGINAHINADLYTALVDLKYKHEKDFFLVNDILQEVTPQVMQYLTVSHHDFFGATALAFKQFTIDEFHTIIERWRSEAWVHMLLTKPSNKKYLHQTTIQFTEELADLLIQDFDALIHFQNPPEIMKHLNTRSIRRV